MTVAEFSLSILMAIQSFLGIEPYPEKPSSDWTIVQEWKEVEHKHYETILESSSLPKKCRDNSKKFVEFSRIVVGLHKVYGDGNLIFSSSNLQKEGYYSNFGVPIIPCEKLLKFNKIRWLINSNSVLFSVIKEYPRLTNNKLTNFFSEHLFIFSFSSIFMLAFVTIFLFLGKVAKKYLVITVFQQFFYGIFLFTFVSGVMGFDFSNLFIHKIMAISVAIANTLFILSLSFRFKVRNEFIAISCLVTLFNMGVNLVSSDHHVIQLSIYSSLPLIFGALLITSLFLFHDCITVKKNKFYNGLAGIGISLCLFSATNDLFITFRIIDSTPFLWAGLLGMQVLFLCSYYYLIKQDEIEITEIEKKIEKMEGERISLEERKLLVDEVIHDLKSPIGMLKIISSDENQSSNKKLIQKSLNRVISIANRLNTLKSPKVAKTVLVRSFKDCLFEIIEEKKKNLVKDIEITTNGLSCNDSFFVYCNKSEVGEIFSNILNNSIDAIKDIGEINISLSVDVNNITLTFKDSGNGIPNSVLERIGKTRFSYGKIGGAGIGLYKSIQMIKSWGGEFKIMNNNSESGVTVQVTFVKINC